MALFALPTYWSHHRFATIRRNVSYVPGSRNPKLQMDIYTPKSLTGFPLVQFIHGGYWVSGDKNYHQWISGLYAAIGCVLAKQGVGTVIANYRLSPETAIAGQLADVTAAIRYTLDQRAAWGAGTQLSLMGHSAGGHLTALLAARQTFPEINQYIALSPILDIADMEAYHAAQQPSFNIRVTYPVFGADRSSWQDYSPTPLLLSNQSALDKLLVVTAANDFSYIQAQARSAETACSQIGHTLRHQEIPGLNHMQMVVDFGKSDSLLLAAILPFLKPVTAAA